jgi:phage baseplate assembly protein W
MSDRPPSFLGTGWAFPPAFAPGGAAVEMVSDTDDVHQALRILFATRQGERPMQEDFGCNLDAYQFAEIDHGLVNELHTLIEDTVLRHEPRVRLLELDVSPDESEAGVLQIRLDYEVVGTNSRFNMVFPFYVNEATAVDH